MFAVLKQGAKACRLQGLSVEGSRGTWDPHGFAGWAFALVLCASLIRGCPDAAPKPGNTSKP